MTGGKDAFLELLERSSAELYADHPDLMDTGSLIPTPNEIHEDDVSLFDEGRDAGPIKMPRGGQFNTLARQPQDVQMSRGANEMARVVMQAVVSADGYIAYPDDTVGPLFDWYGNGDVTVHVNDKWPFRVSRASADYVQPFWDDIKVTVIGRRLFDTTDGWAGVPAAGDELVVVTHRPLPEQWLARFPDAPFHTADSVEAAITLAKELAGDGLICVTAGDVGGQAFSAGLVDEVAMDVAPVVLGEGVRFFGSHAGTVLLDDPDVVVQGDRVLHLHYTVKR